MAGVPRRQSKRFAPRSTTSRSISPHEAHTGQQTLANLSDINQEQSLHHEAELIQNDNHQSKSPSTVPQRCLLLELPGEIRGMILKRLLLDDLEPVGLREVLDFRANFLFRVAETIELAGHNILIQRKEELRQTFDILQICKQLRHEAANLFFGNVTFVAHEIKDMCGFLQVLDSLAQYIQSIWILDFSSTIVEQVSKYATIRNTVTPFDGEVVFGRFIPVLEQLPLLDTIILPGSLGNDDCLELIRDGEVPGAADRTNDDMLNCFAAIARCAAGMAVAGPMKLPATIICSDSFGGAYEKNPYTIPADFGSREWRNAVFRFRHAGRILMSKKTFPQRPR